MDNYEGRVPGPKIGTRQFYAIQDQFERDCKALTFGHHWDRVSREDSEHVPVDQFYNDGHVNELFHVYMRGFAYHEALSREQMEKGWGRVRD